MGDWQFSALDSWANSQAILADLALVGEEMASRVVSDLAILG